jgi:imidazolonepropionase-like amidohydrolase
MGLVDGPRLVVGGIVAATLNHPEISALGRHSHLVKTGRDVADGPWEVRKRVRKLIGLDVDFIKVFASGWGGEVERDWWPNFTVGEITAICEEAHRYRKKVAAHVSSATTIHDAANAGCDTLEHLVEIEDRTIELILERDIILIPTLDIYSERALARRKVHQKPAVIDQVRRTGERAVEAFRRCLEAGIRMAAGTDIYRTVRHGENAGEIVAMVEYGMTEMVALMAATKIGAEALALGEDLGTLVPGKWADLLLVEGDPLRDIHVLEDQKKIRVVMIGGEIKVDRRPDSNS